MGLPLTLGSFGTFTPGEMFGLANWGGGAWQTLAVAGNVTLTPAQMVAAGETFLTITGAAGAVNATTPSAQQLMQQLVQLFGSAPPVGFTFKFEISNQNNNTVTLVAGTGVTINGTASVATTANRSWLATITSVGNPSASFAGATITFQNLASRSN